MELKFKRGALFSTDALIAMVIIFLSIAVIYPVTKYSFQRTELPADLIASLSSLGIGEINSSYVMSLASSGVIDNLNNSVLEQIGEFYALDSPYAEGLAEEVLSMIETDRNVGIWYGDYLLASINSTPFETSENVDVERQVIGGIEKGEDIHGYSARAFLSRSSAEKYFYFGGYVGDGNISVQMDYDGEIRDANLEIAINKEFDLYINGVFSGHYDKSPSSLEPAKYPLLSYTSNFNSGSNTVELKGDNLYIAGGFLRVSYMSSSAYEQSTRYYFPGIDGVINLYDGFYIPGNLSTLKVSLHLDTDYKAFLTIGNVTVFSGITAGEETITLTDAQLSALLDYDKLKEKTTPLRLGLENVSYISNETRDADVFSVTDLSGSMAAGCSGSSPWYCCWFQQDCSTQAGCSACNGNFEDPIGLAKEANNAFINAVLNNSQNRVGLAGYRDSSSTSDYHILSNDNESLISEVNGWNANGGTCICCGINRAIDDLVSDSDSSKFRSMVVMSDGEANRYCNGFSDYTGSSGDNAQARQDAIDSACYAYNNYGIKVYAVGFGSDADETTLQAIATCGNGSYYNSSVEELVEIYQQIAQEIIEASYSEQTIEVTGEISTRLYPDSYIEFDYFSPNIPYGLVVTAEAEGFDNVSQGVLTIPDESSVLEAFAISYSGPRWTSFVKINNSVVYNLSNYGSNFISLGDPYSVSILPELLSQGDNPVEIKTAAAPSEFGEGSSFNKVVYTIVKPFLSYSKISASIEGCLWNVSLENGQTIIARIPGDYSDENSCFYQPGNIIYNENDAIDYAVYNLLSNLDFDDDGSVNIIFEPEDLEISSNEITGIPFTWATEVQIRTWD